MFIRQWAIVRRVFRQNLSGGVRPEKHVQVCVVSPGGVGTTMLIGYIGRFRSTNCAWDCDGLKHLPRPPGNIESSDVKFIFVRGNAEDIYRSIKRRGWLDTQGGKLGSFMCALSRGWVQKRCFKQAVERQARHWTANNASNLLIVDYEEIWDSIDKLAAFIDIDCERFNRDFPLRNPRIALEVSG